VIKDEMLGEQYLAARRAADNIYFSAKKCVFKLRIFRGVYSVPQLGLKNLAALAFYFFKFSKDIFSPIRPLKKPSTLLITQIYNNDYTDTPTGYNLCNLFYNRCNQRLLGFSIILI